MPSIASTLHTRTTPLSPAERDALFWELVSDERALQVDVYLDDVRDHAHLIGADTTAAFIEGVRHYRTALSRDDLTGYTGHVARTPDGHLIDPSMFQFMGYLDPRDRVGVYITKPYAKGVQALIEADEFKTYFLGAYTQLEKTLAVARIITEYDTRALNRFFQRKGAVDVQWSEEQRTDLAWELLARVDAELKGYKSERGIHSQKFLASYQQLKGFIVASGFKPMSQRALAARDGRDRPFALLSGQGANYLKDLNMVLALDADGEPLHPNAHALYQLLKPLFAKYGIDVDELRRLEKADQNLIENYLMVNGVRVSMPVSSLARILMARALEDYGFNFYRFSGVMGQSGGQPDAAFLAGAFEKEGYQPPLIPHGATGYHTLKAYRDHMEWMLVEGRLQQAGTEPAYAPDVTRVEPLVKRDGGKFVLPTAAEIDTYFSRYRIHNLSLSGIPYSRRDADGIRADILDHLRGDAGVSFEPDSNLGRILYEINQKFLGQGSYVFMSNLNTPATKTGARSYFVFVAGQGPALGELAKLLMVRDATGYSEQVQEIIAALPDFNDETNKAVRPPIADTRVSLSAHDAIILAQAHDQQLATMSARGVHVRRPAVPVVHNWTGENMKEATGDNGAALSRQQYLELVDLPLMVEKALTMGMTSFMDIGTGGTLASIYVPAILDGRHVDTVGTLAQDAEQVSGFERLTTRDPGLAFIRSVPPNEAEQADALEGLQAIDGITAHRIEDGIVSVRFDRALGSDDFETFKKLFFSLHEGSPLFQALQTAQVKADGQAESNALRGLLRNQPNLEIRLYFQDGGLEAVVFVEASQERVELRLDEGVIEVAEWNPLEGGQEEQTLARKYRFVDNELVQENVDQFRSATRAAYATDWDLEIPTGPLGAVVTDEAVASTDRMVRFANSLESRNDPYVNPNNPDFQAHPHFIIDLAWRAMLTPTFHADLGMDFTRVIDEGKTIELGALIKPGDTITTTAHLVRVEDFKKGPLSGRRAVVLATLTNQAGEVVGRVLSTMVSRIPVAIASGEEPRVVYENTSIDTNFDFTRHKRVHSYEKPVEVAKGSLTIPRTLASSYGAIDPNRIHLSDLSAALAGIPHGRVMQGLGTLAYVNEQIVQQLQLDLQLRALRGISNLEFKGFVLPGAHLTYSVERLGVAQGEHLLRVKVINPEQINQELKKDGVVLVYDMVAQGPKEAIIVPGQGFQYVGMGKHITHTKQENGEYKEHQEHRVMLDVMQGWIPTDAQGEPVVNLFEAMEAGAQETDRAQPMIIAYTTILAIDALSQGLIADDAAFTGHSLGMWGAIFINIIQNKMNEFARTGRTFQNNVELLQALEPILKPIIGGVAMRGAVMEKYVDKTNPQGLLKVQATEASGPLRQAHIDLLREIINKAGDVVAGVLPRYMDVANYNTRDVTIVGGHQSALKQAAYFLAAWGFKVSPVPVKNGFHTALMQVASDDFGTWMARVGNPFVLPDPTRLYSDTHAKPIAEIGSGDVNALARVMQDQISSSVRFHQTIERLLRDGYRVFKEIGTASGYDKAKGHMVGSPAGGMSAMIKAEVAALVNEGVIAPSERVTVIFANPILNPNGVKQMTFEAIEAVSEYNKPTVIFPVQVKPVAVAQAAGQAGGATSGSTGQTETQGETTIVPVSAAALTAAIDGFFINHPVAGADQAVLAAQLRDVVLALGPGARTVASQRLAQLSPVASAQPAASTGPSVEEQIIAHYSKSRSNVTANSDLIGDFNFGSSDVPNEVEALNKLLAVSVDASDFEGMTKLTIQQLAAHYVKKGAQAGSGAATAAPTASELTPRDKIEQQALIDAIARWPQAVGATAAGRTYTAVSAQQVEEIRQAFLAEHAAVIQSGALDPLVSQLAARYEALGPGAVGVLQSRLQALGAPAGATQSSASAGPSVEEQIIAHYSKSRSNVTANSDLIGDFNFGSSDVPNEVEALNKLLAVAVDASDFEGMTKLTIQQLAAHYVKKGAKAGGGTATAAAPMAVSLSAEDQVDQRAISQVLPRLQALAMQGATGGVASLDPGQLAALNQQIQALEARIAELEAGRGRSSTQAGVDKPVRIIGDAIVDERDIEITALRQRLENIRLATSDQFVGALTQPHGFDGSRIYGFSGVNLLGGRANLMKFIADLRHERLTTNPYDRQVDVHALANQLDEVSTAWLATIIENAKLNQWDPAHIRQLEELHDLAKTHLAQGTIITKGVITARGVRFIPEHGSPHKVVPVARTEGTLELLAEMAPVGDPRAVGEIEWLLSEGIDLRGVRALIQQSGTMTAPLTAKLLRFGASVDVSDRKNRSVVLPNGGLNNDYYWHLYSDNATRASALRVLPEIQPGNPHDEKALIEYYEKLADHVVNFEKIVEGDAKQTFLAQAALIDLLADHGLGAKLRARYAQVAQQRMAEGLNDSTTVVTLSAEERLQFIQGILPQLYANGAAYEDYPSKFASQGPAKNEAKPFDTLAILTLSSRNVALNLARLHKKFKTGKQVVFLNYYSPNSGIDLAAKAEEVRRAIERDQLPEVVRILEAAGVDQTLISQIRDVLLKPAVSAEARARGIFSILANSGTYPLSKAALAPGLVAAEALANGMVHEDGTPILIEVSAKTGWGKSDGHKATIMSKNDFFTEMLEAFAERAGVKLLTLTGDQLGTAQTSGLLSAFAGRTKAEGPHVSRNYTYGFDAAAEAGVLTTAMTEVPSAEMKKHTEAKDAWKAAHPVVREDPSHIPNDGSLINLNKLNIAIAGVDPSHPYALRDGDILFGDDVLVDSGYGMVGPLGPDALTNYRNMLASGHFKGHEGFGWLGEYDFYNLARSMGIDVSAWDYEKMAQAEGLDQGPGGWVETFQRWLKDNSGIQQIGEFLEFEVLREVKFAERTEIAIEIPEDVARNEALAQKWLVERLAKFQLYGYALHQREGGSYYAVAEAGQSYQLPMTYRLPASAMGALPGNERFDFHGTFGVTKSVDMKTEARGAFMAKMFAAQIIMSMGGYSPEELHQEFGAENMQVAIGTGLGDLKPFNRMTVEGVLKDTVPNYLMAGLLPDASTGQIATEMLGAKGMALCVVAACSTGNANIVMAMKAQFGQYYQFAKKMARLKETGKLEEFLAQIADPRERFAAAEAANTDWAEVFSQLWIAGGVDYAVTFNSVFGFIGLGAIIAEDWQRARDLALKHLSRPDDSERNGFVIGSGGGAQALESLAKVRARGGAAYGMVIGGAFRTDGYKNSREGYGWGQRGALFEAWGEAQHYLTEYRHELTDIEAAIDEALEVKNWADQDLARSVMSALKQASFENKVRRPSVGTQVAKYLSAKYGIEITAENLRGMSRAEVATEIREQTRALKKNCKIIVMAHKTSTGAGDPYEEESLLIFLSKILPRGEFAHIVKTKAHLAHLLGGSSGADAALTPLILAHRAIPGVPGLDNLDTHAAANPYLLHHKEALNLREIYDEDTTFVVIREAAGFNAKNTAVVEVYGKIPMRDEAEALNYTKRLVRNYVRERVQKRAERLGLRTMVFDTGKFPEVPMSQFRDLYELYIRADALAAALLGGRKFDLTGEIREEIRRRNGGRTQADPKTKLRVLGLNRHGITNLIEVLNKRFGAQLEVEALGRWDRATVGDLIKAYQKVGAFYNGFEREHLLSWIYEFPVDASVQFADKDEDRLLELSQKKITGGKDAPFPGQEALEFDRLRTRYDAHKYAEAYREIHKIMATFDPAEIVRVGEKARARGWDKQPVVFYGMSDGMGMRTLLALIASGAVKEVVGIHRDLPPQNEQGQIAPKSSSYSPEILKAYAASLGVNLTVHNTNGILFDMQSGAALPLQQEIKDSVEAARARSEVKDILFWDSVAFGAPWRRPGSPAFFVPTINEYGELEYVQVSTAKDQAQAEVATLKPMGHNHARLLSLFHENGWFGEKSASFTFDWWGSESEDMLSGVYGGAVLGDAKNIAKAETAAFMREHPDTGVHAYNGYPAFLSFALNAIPGGTLTGLISKRLYEDIQGGMQIEGVVPPTGMELRFYSMEELSHVALVKFLSGDLSGPNGNKVAVDGHEQAVAREIDRRFKLIKERLLAKVEEKKVAFFAANPQAKEADFRAKLTQAESFEVLREFVPADYLDYCYQHIKSVRERRLHTRMTAQESQGIERLPLPRALQTEFPFFARAISSDINTPALAIRFIDEGGVGTLFADDKSGEEVLDEIREVHDQVGSYAPLVVNLMVGNSHFDEQLSAVIQAKPAAVSFGNGLVAAEVVKRLHAAGILVIQLLGAPTAAKSIAERGVDLVMAERNYGPGHVETSEKAEPTTLIKRMRQELYEYGIPVIAGGGYIEAEDVREALYWGASGVLLDDAMSYSLESTFPAKNLELNSDEPVVTFVDHAGKTVRLLNTPGAQLFLAQLKRLRTNGFEDRIINPVIEQLILRHMGKAAKGNLAEGIFFASERVASVVKGESLAQTFRRLMGETPDTSTPPSGSGDGPNAPEQRGGPSGGGGGRSRSVRVDDATPRAKGADVAGVEEQARGPKDPDASAVVTPMAEPSRAVEPISRAPFTITDQVPTSDGSAALDIAPRDSDVVSAGGTPRFTIVDDGVGASGTITQVEVIAELKNRGWLQEARYLQSVQLSDEQLAQLDDAIQSGIKARVAAVLGRLPSSAGGARNWAQIQGGRSTLLARSSVLRTIR